MTEREKEAIIRRMEPITITPNMEKRAELNIKELSENASVAEIKTKAITPSNSGIIFDTGSNILDFFLLVSSLVIVYIAKKCIDWFFEKKRIMFEKDYGK